DRTDPTDPTDRLFSSAASTSRIAWCTASPTTRITPTAASRLNDVFVIQNVAATPPRQSGSERNTIAAAQIESNTIATARITSTTPVANTSHSPFELSSVAQSNFSSLMVYPAGAASDFMNASWVRLASLVGPRKS